MSNNPMTLIMQVMLARKRKKKKLSEQKLKRVKRERLLVLDLLSQNLPKKELERSKRKKSVSE